MEFNAKRRGFIKGAGTALGVAAAAGGVVALYGMKRTWDPLPSAIAAGRTEVDLSNMQAGELMTVVYRRKPVFILKKTDLMKSDPKRPDLVVEGERYMLAIGVCTHLGCIPAWNSSQLQFQCACHGGRFDANGVNVFGPPPRPLDLPEFKIMPGKKLVLGETSDEYKKILAAMKA